MPTFTVHEPPLRKTERAADPQRFRFVRDGFHFWAFLLTPLWLAVKRLWLALVLYVVLSIALNVALWLLGVQGPARFIVSLVIGILAGLEAASIQRWTLARRKWKTVGVVVAEDVESAERRFFAQWIEQRDTPTAPPPLVAPAPRRPASGNEVIGLFPEPRP